MIFSSSLTVFPAPGTRRVEENPMVRLAVAVSVSDVSGRENPNLAQLGS